MLFFWTSALIRSLAECILCKLFFSTKHDKLVEKKRTADVEECGKKRESVFYCVPDFNIWQSVVYHHEGADGERREKWGKQRQRVSIWIFYLMGFMGDCISGEAGVKVHGGARGERGKVVKAWDNGVPAREEHTQHTVPYMCKEAMDQTPKNTHCLKFDHSAWSWKLPRVFLFTHLFNFSLSQTYTVQTLSNLAFSLQQFHTNVHTHANVLGWLQVWS